MCRVLYQVLIRTVTNAMSMICYNNCKYVTRDTECYVYYYVKEHITSTHIFKLASQSGPERWLSG